MLPPGWHRKFFGEADLEGAFRLLDGNRDFFAETMRGYIRSLQLRFDAAWEHLDRAVILSESAEETVDNLVNRFLLEIHRFETALVQRPVDPDTETLGGPPVIPRAFLIKHPQVRMVLDMRKACEAKLLLHLGDSELAADMYRELIRDNDDAQPDILAGYYLNLAACEQGRGSDDQVALNLENAGFAISSIDGALQAARGAATLAAFYAFLLEEGLMEEDHAKEWRVFLEDLDCPEETKKLFVERAERLLERCRRHDYLVTF